MIFTFDSNGNVGVGTTSPSAKLSITGSGSGAGRAFAIADNTNVEKFTVLDNGNLGLGTTNPGSLLAINGPNSGIWNTVAEFNAGNGNDNVGSVISMRAADVAGRIEGGRILAGRWSTTDRGIRIAGVPFAGATTGSELNYIHINAQSSELRFATAGSDRLLINLTGHVGIGTTTPWRTLSVTGTVGFDGLTGSTGAGSLCLDSNKQVVYNSASDSCLSSTRATKHDINPLVIDALSQVLALQPVSFIYNEGDGRTRFGFIAEDTGAIDPHLVTYDASSTVSGIDDRSIIAILVGAVKDLANKVSETAHLVIDAITARVGNFGRVNTNELCVGTTCVTEEQFNAVFNNQSAAAGAPTVGNTNETPSGSSASGGSPDTDTGTTTTAASASSSTSTPAAANDNQPIADAENEPEAQEPTPEPTSEVVAEPVPIPVPANDNPPPPALPATGTE